MASEVKKKKCKVVPQQAEVAQDEHLRLETCRGEYYFMNK